MGGVSSTTATYFLVMNDTNVAVRSTSVDSLDHSVFVGNDTPDKKLINTSIPPGSFLERRLEMKDKTNDCTFRMILFFKDGSLDKFTINQRWAFDDDCYRLDTYNSDHVIKLERYSNKGIPGLKVIIQPTEKQQHEIKARNLIDKANKFMQQKKYQEALQVYEEALKIAEKQVTKNKAEEGISDAKKKFADEQAEKINKLLDQANKLMQQKKYSEALHVYEEVLKTAEKPETKAKAQEGISNAKKEITNEQAEKLIDKANKLVQQKQYLEAIGVYEDALKIAEKQETKNKAQEGISDAKKKIAKEQDDKINKLLDQASKLMQQKKYQEAMQVYKEVVNLAKKPETKTKAEEGISNAMKEITNEQAETLIDQANKLVQQKQYVEAIRLYEEALSFAQKPETKKKAQDGISIAKKKIPNDQAEELNNEAIQLIKNNEFEKAIKLCEEALTHANEKQTIDEINKTQKQAKIKFSEYLMKEAKILMDQGQLDAAIKLLDKIKELKKLDEMPNVERKAKVLLSSALTESGIVQYNKAKALEQDRTKDNAGEARKLLEEAKKNLEKAVAHKRTPKADEYLRKLA